MIPPEITIKTNEQGLAVPYYKGETLRGVTKIEIEPIDYAESPLVKAKLTFVGVELDIEAEVPEHLVKVVSPNL